MAEKLIAATEKHREPQHTKKLPVLFSGSNPEIVASSYKNHLNSE